MKIIKTNDYVEDESVKALLLYIFEMKVAVGKAVACTVTALDLSGGLHQEPNLVTILD